MNLSLGALLLFGGLVSGLGAHPLDKAFPEQDLYQRVQRLGEYGLLDPQDRAVLERGETLTRLDLAHLARKASARLPFLESGAIPPPLQLAAAPAQDAAGTAQAVQGAKADIQALLKALVEEDTLLRSRLRLDDRRASLESAELDRLKATQDEVDAAYRKSNRSSGSPNLESVASLRAESLEVSGITRAGGFHMVEQVNIGVRTDLGGKGNFSTGFGGSVPFSNASANSVTLYLSSPSLYFGLDGRLGHWDNNVTTEAYSGDTDLGNFTRGSPSGRNRYERPFDIKNYSEDKNTRTWDDYMNNLGYVPSYSTFTTGSTSARVFAGLYMKGTRLPLVSPNATMLLILGRTDATQRWEQGVKYSQPWLGGRVNTSLSTLWMNEHYGIHQFPRMDLKTYAVDVGMDLRPFFLELEGALSRFGTGLDSLNPSNPAVLKDSALQASLNAYPFTVYYTAIGPDFANVQSKATVTGIDFARYGYAAYNDSYGYLGMADELVTNRTGWRANMGWKGRQQAWMKSWPGFLDSLVVNLDAAGKKESRVVLDTTGYNSLEAAQFLEVYYPDGTGLWGNNLWGGYNGAHGAGQATIDNLAALRNDGLAYTPFRFGMGTTRRIPLIVPVFGPGSQPTTYTSGPQVGQNVYIPLTHTKTFNYLTLTTKLKLSQLLELSNPLYAGFFFTDHRVSGSSSDPVLAATPNPFRAGETLATIPDLFHQKVYEGSLMFQVIKNVNLMGVYGLETWRSAYTYPAIDTRTLSRGLGLAYDIPWGGGKWEARYKRVTFEDSVVPANNYKAGQVYSYLVFKF